MKNLLILCLISLFALPAIAQYGYTVDVVEASEVPAEVTSTHEAAFPDAEVKRWELHTGKGKNNSNSKYVAVCNDNGNALRARYKTDGTGISATTYYRRAANAPAEVVETLEELYPDFSLRSGEKIYSFKKDDFVYRARLRQGGSKLVVYLDSEGNKIEKKDLPDEVKEAEMEDAQGLSPDK